MTGFIQSMAYSTRAYFNMCLTFEAVFSAMVERFYEIKMLIFEKVHSQNILKSVESLMPW